MNAQQIRAYRQQAAKEGLCTRCCWRYPIKGKATCQDCLRYRVEHRRKAQMHP